MLQNQDIEKMEAAALARLLGVADRTLANQLSKIRRGKTAAGSLPPFFWQPRRPVIFFNVNQWLVENQFGARNSAPPTRKEEEKRKRGRKTNREKARLAASGGGAE